MNPGELINALAETRLANTKFRQKLAAYECEVAQLKCQVERYRSLIVALTSGGEMDDIDIAMNRDPCFVLVCGGRLFDDWPSFNKAMVEARPTQIIHGGCKTWHEEKKKYVGADHFADLWAGVGTPVKTEKADWKRYGNSAGPRRNQKMLDENAIDKVIAFPGGRGTADMVRRARKAGIPVIEVPEGYAQLATPDAEQISNPAKQSP